jgi:predicted Rossmann fold nucleotide-binding protein DprA/Smf involved in DNA uptake
MSRVIGSRRDLVRHALAKAGRALTTDEVAAATGIPRAEVIFPLCSLARDGRIEKRGELLAERTWTIAQVST